MNNSKCLFALLLITGICCASESEVTVYSFKKNGMSVNGNVMSVDSAANIYNKNPKAPSELCIEFESNIALVDEFNSKVVNDGPETQKGTSKKTCP